MSNRPSRPPFLPLPDAVGIAQTKALYKERFGRDISDEEAVQILGPVMRFLYLTSELANEVKTPEVTAGPPLTPARGTRHS